MLITMTGRPFEIGHRCALLGDIARAMRVLIGQYGFSTVGRKRPACASPPESQNPVIAIKAAITKLAQCRMRIVCVVVMSLQSMAQGLKAGDKHCVNWGPASVTGVTKVGSEGPYSHPSHR
ncbi:MAG: hypothetical protein R3D01_09390 [Hyphomicrobiales bacterium]